MRRASDIILSSGRRLQARTTGEAGVAWKGRSAVMRLAQHTFSIGPSRDYRLTTAEILYRLPDHPALLQSYIWQELDIAPQYPVLNKFLDFWRREIEGTLHSVRVASASLGGLSSGRHGRVRHADTLLRIH
jgi:uncharacterized protein Usg